MKKIAEKPSGQTTSTEPPTLCQLNKGSSDLLSRSEGKCRDTDTPHQQHLTDKSLSKAFEILISCLFVTIFRDVSTVPSLWLHL